jgi:hypothetical protein
MDKKEGPVVGEVCPHDVHSKDSLNNKRSIDVPHCKPVRISISHVTVISTSRLTAAGLQISGECKIVIAMNFLIDLPSESHRAHLTEYY